MKVWHSGISKLHFHIILDLLTLFSKSIMKNKSWSPHFFFFSCLALNPLSSASSNNLFSWNYMLLLRFTQFNAAGAIKGINFSCISRNLTTRSIKQQPVNATPQGWYALKDPEWANSKCQSCSPVSALWMTEGRWTSLRDPQGKKFLQDLVFLLAGSSQMSSQASSIKSLWDRLSASFPECLSSQRAGFCWTNLWRCNPQRQKQSGWPFRLNSLMSIFFSSCKSRNKCWPLLESGFHPWRWQPGLL